MIYGFFILFFSRTLFQLTVGIFTKSDMSKNSSTVTHLMSVEDTDFSPPATAVMFFLTIHPIALESEDFLSTGVKSNLFLTHSSRNGIAFFHFSIQDGFCERIFDFALDRAF